MKTTTLKIEQIRQDPQLQSRLYYDPKTQLDLNAIAAEGNQFPPLEIYRVTDKDNEFYLVDGHHRLNAYKYAKINEVQVNLHEGTWQDALYASWRSNMAHGVPFTKAEKWKIARKALATPGLMNLSNREIAKKIGVHESFIRAVKKVIAAEESGQVQKFKSSSTSSYKRNNKDDTSNTQIEFLKAQNKKLTQQVEELTKQLALLNQQLKEPKQPAQPVPETALKATPSPVETISELIDTQVQVEQKEDVIDDSTAKEQEVIDDNFLKRAKAIKDDKGSVIDRSFFNDFTWELTVKKVYSENKNNVLFG